MDGRGNVLHSSIYCGQTVVSSKCVVEILSRHKSNRWFYPTKYTHSTIWQNPRPALYCTRFTDSNFIVQQLFKDCSNRLWNYDLQRSRKLFKIVYSISRIFKATNLRFYYLYKPIHPNSFPNLLIFFHTLTLIFVFYYISNCKVICILPTSLSFLSFFLSYLGWYTLPPHASAEACLTGWPNAHPQERD